MAGIVDVIGIICIDWVSGPVIVVRQGGAVLAYICVFDLLWRWLCRYHRQNHLIGFALFDVWCAYD